jgi:hypothetical protein
MTGRLLLASIALACLACSAQRDEFCNKVFQCDLHAAEDPCGKSCRGKPMICYAGSQLGGADFCAEACDPAQGSDDPAFTCTTAGALLQICHPTGGGTDPSAGCPAGLQCYRTDLLKDDGVCMALHVCATDGDCAGSDRTVCAATILKTQSSLPLPLDHLQCLTKTCRSSQSDCLAGESCLIDYYNVSTTPDICVPNCASRRTDGGVDELYCPPNFTCAAVAAGAGSPAICLPGVPGQRCVADQDCLIGTCFDTGAGFRVCVPPTSCNSDVYCAMFVSDIHSVCVPNAQTGRGVCISSIPFDGANCNEPTDAPTGQCPAGQACYHGGPYGPGEGQHGECRVPCDGLTCPDRGGIPHVCLADGSCYPTWFAMPCTESADCLSEFTCLPVSPDPRTVITSPTICTVACANDDECRSNPLILNNAFCDPDHLCRMSGTAGSPCERNEQCREGLCLPDQSGQLLCQI